MTSNWPLALGITAGILGLLVLCAMHPAVLAGIVLAVVFVWFALGIKRILDEGWEAFDD